MIRVNIILNVKADPKEYPVPSDGDVGQEIEDYLKDIIHEVDGLKETSIRVRIQET